MNDEENRNIKVNVLKNINNNNNIGKLYSLLSYLIINLDSPKSLYTYLEYLMENKELQALLAMIFSAASKTLNNDEYLANINCTLPIEYTRDIWRNHRLIIDIFENQPKTVVQLEKLIHFWQNENPMYL